MTGLATRVRPAVLADAPEVARVHVQTWHNAYAGLIDDDYLVAMSEAGQTQMWRRQIASRGKTGSVLVAEAPDGGLPGGGTPRGETPGGEAGRVVGFGSCGLQRKAPQAYQAEIYTLYVEVDWQGQGIGLALMTGMFETLRREGLNSAFLWVLGGNPSRFFYESLGGERLAERVERFAGKDLEELAYGWPDLEAWLKERC